MLAAIPPEAEAEMPVATALIRAEVLERMGSLAEATAQFESALESHPEGAWLFRLAMGLARCRVALGSPQDAREPLRDALQVAIGTSVRSDSRPAYQLSPIGDDQAQPGDQSQRSVRPGATLTIRSSRLRSNLGDRNGCRRSSMEGAPVPRVGRPA